MVNNKSFIFIMSSFLIFLSFQDVSADLAVMGSSFNYDHPKESALYAYIALFALISFVIAFSLIILGNIKRQKKSKNDLSLKK